MFQNIFYIFTKIPIKCKRNLEVCEKHELKLNEPQEKPQPYIYRQNTLALVQMLTSFDNLHFPAVRF